MLTGRNDGGFRRTFLLLLSYIYIIIIYIVYTTYIYFISCCFCRFLGGISFFVIF